MAKKHMRLQGKGGGGALCGAPVLQPRITKRADRVTCCDCMRLMPASEAGKAKRRREWNAMGPQERAAYLEGATMDLEDLPDGAYFQAREDMERELSGRD